jgi:hypothetical protein
MSSGLRFINSLKYHHFFLKDDQGTDPLRHVLELEKSGATWQRFIVNWPKPEGYVHTYH